MRVQDDWTVMLEAVKHPLQFVTVLENGRPGDVRGIVDKDPAKRFCVYCKVRQCELLTVIYKYEGQTRGCAGNR